jgi:hypothetical protein
VSSRSLIDQAPLHVAQYASTARPVLSNARRALRVYLSCGRSRLHFGHNEVNGTHRLADPVSGPRTADMLRGVTPSCVTYGNLRHREAGGVAGHGHYLA